MLDPSPLPGPASAAPGRGAEVQEPIEEGPEVRSGLFWSLGLGPGAAWAGLSQLSSLPEKTRVPGPCSYCRRHPPGSGSGLGCWSTAPAAAPSRRCPGRRERGRCQRVGPEAAWCQSLRSCCSPTWHTWRWAPACFGRWRALQRTSPTSASSVTNGRCCRTSPAWTAQRWTR